MAPPPVTNMPVLRSITQRTTRQTAQQPSQYVIDDKEASDEFDEDGNTYVDHETMEEELDESQGTSVETLMSTMVNKQRKRHADKRQSLHQSYTADCKSVEESINTSFNEHEEKSAAAHEAQLERLTDLLTRKTQIEKELGGKLADLRGSYVAHSLDVERVIGTRIKELK